VVVAGELNEERRSCEQEGWALRSINKKLKLGVHGPQRFAEPMPSPLPYLAACWVTCGPSVDWAPASASPAFCCACAASQLHRPGWSHLVSGPRIMQLTSLGTPRTSKFKRHNRQSASGYYRIEHKGQFCCSSRLIRCLRLTKRNYGTWSQQKWCWLRLDFYDCEVRTLSLRGSPPTCPPFQHLRYPFSQ